MKIQLLTLLLVTAIHGQCFAIVPDDCATVKFSGYGNIAIHKNLIKYGLRHALLPYHELTTVDLIPPTNGIIEGGFYVDSLTLHWSDSHNPKPQCDLKLAGTMAGNYYNCFVDWQNKPLAVGVLIHTQVSNFDLDGLVLQMKDYIDKEVLSCPQPKNY